MGLLAQSDVDQRGLNLVPQEYIKKRGPRGAPVVRLKNPNWFVDYFNARVATPLAYDFRTQGFNKTAPWTKDELTDYYYQTIGPQVSKALGSGSDRAKNAGRLYHAIETEVADRLKEQAALGTGQVLDLAKAKFDINAYDPTRQGSRKALQKSLALGAIAIPVGLGIGEALSGLGGAASVGGAGGGAGAAGGSSLATEATVGANLLASAIPEITVTALPYSGGSTIGAALSTGAGAGAVGSTLSSTAQPSIDEVISTAKPYPSSPIPNFIPPPIYSIPEHTYGQPPKTPETLEEMEAQLKENEAELKASEEGFNKPQAGSQMPPSSDTRPWWQKAGTTVGGTLLNGVPGLTAPTPEAVGPSLMPMAGAPVPGRFNSSIPSLAEFIQMQIAANSPRLRGVPYG